MKHKIAVITLCYNESKIIPFVIDYWRRFAEHVYVFDNGSTDNSIEMLSSYHWITVIDYSHLTGNKLDDIMNMNIKNNFWKTIKHNYDWIVVCDFDECLYCEDWDMTLDYFNKVKIECISPKYYNMICEKFPEYIEGSLFHYDNIYASNVSQEDYDYRYTKLLLFNPKHMMELNLEPGSHSAHPISIFSSYMQEGSPMITTSVFVRTTGIYCYHLCDIGLDYIIQKRIHNKNERMTEKQLKYNFALHYMVDEEQIRNGFYEQWKNKIEID